MNGNRPWDFKQEFTVDGDGNADATGNSLGAGYGNLVNHVQRDTADAVERFEVATLAEDARERHHLLHPQKVSGCHECAVWENRKPLNDVPWSFQPSDIPHGYWVEGAVIDPKSVRPPLHSEELTNESTGYPPVRQAFTGHLGEP